MKGNSHKMIQNPPDMICLKSTATSNVTHAQVKRLTSVLVHVPPGVGESKFWRVENVNLVATRGSRAKGNSGRSIIPWRLASGQRYAIFNNSLSSPNCHSSWVCHQTYRLQWPVASWGRGWVPPTEGRPSSSSPSRERRTCQSGSSLPPHEPLDKTHENYRKWRLSFTNMVIMITLIILTSPGHPDGTLGGGVAMQVALGPDAHCRRNLRKIHTHLGTSTSAFLYIQVYWQEPMNPYIHHNHTLK